MKRVPLNSPEGRRFVERGPAWREHPDYYRDEPPEEEPPWFTEEHVALGVARMKTYARNRGLRRLHDREWENLARVCLGMKAQP